MNRVLDVGRRARRETRRAELRRRGRPARRVEPGPRPSGRLRDVWPSADRHRPRPATTVRVLGTRSAPASLADRATRPAADRTAVTASPGPVVVARSRSTAPRAVDHTPEAAPATPSAPLISAVREVEVDPEPTVVPAVAPTLAFVPAIAPQPVPAVVPAIAPQPVPAVMAAAEPVPVPEASRPAHRRRWVLAAVAAVVVVGGGAAGVTLLASPADRPVAAASAEPGSAVVRWLRANPVDSPVATTDPALRRDLAAAGVDVANADSAAALSTGALLVTADSAGSAAPTAIDGGRALVPVARFTDRASTVLVAQVVDRTAREVTTAAATERSTAATAAAGLLANDGLTVGASARPAFEAGSLDLRAAAFLALLANTSPTQVVQVPVDDAERAAGLPDRRVVVVTDAAVLRNAVAGSRPPFAPVIATTQGQGLPAGSVTLTWPLSADPMSVVS